VRPGLGGAFNQESQVVPIKLIQAVDSSLSFSVCVGDVDSHSDWALLLMRVRGWLFYCWIPAFAGMTAGVRG